MALPAAIAIGARALTPILARAGASAGTRAAVSSIGSAAGKVALTQTLGSAIGKGMGAMGGGGGGQSTDSGLDAIAPEVEEMGRMSCFMGGCNS